MQNLLPAWVRWVNAISLTLYVIATLLCAVIAAGILLQALNDLEFVILFADPVAFGRFIKLLLLLIFTACFIFSLLAHSSVGSLNKAYRQGGPSAVRQQGWSIWGIAIFAQMMSWAALLLFLVLFPPLSFFGGGDLDIESKEAFVAAVQASVRGSYWLMIAPFLLFFIPGCLRIAPLAYFARIARRPVKLDDAPNDR